MAIVENKVLERFVEIAYTTLLIILVSIVVGLIMAFPVMWLWNFVFGTILKINVFHRLMHAPHFMVPRVPQ